jgi:hypothetical protein
VYAEEENKYCLNRVTSSVDPRQSPTLRSKSVTSTSNSDTGSIESRVEERKGVMVSRGQVVGGEVGIGGVRRETLIGGEMR